MWRSLLVAREVLEKGSRWIIGDGKKVKTWEDRWLLTPHTFKVLSPRSQVQVLDRVKKLIDKEKGSCDADLVNSNFVAHEAKVILSIPVSTTLPKDSQVWARTRNGSFIVRSAYKVAINLIKEGKKQVVLGESSNRSKMKEFWKFIWKLECPNKVKQFFWKACKNILSTNSTLVS